MKTFLFALVASLASPVAFADVRDLGNFKRVEISEQGAQSVTVTLTYTFSTVDGCNSFGTSGDFYSLTLNQGESRLYAPFVADLSVVGTELGCPDLPTPREVTVEYSKTFAAGPYGGVYLDLWLPEVFALTTSVDR
jgi:hypothetical protein